MVQKKTKELLTCVTLSWKLTKISAILIKWKSDVIWVNNLQCFRWKFAKVNELTFETDVKMKISRFISPKSPGCKYGVWTFSWVLCLFRIICYQAMIRYIYRFSLMKGKLKIGFPIWKCWKASKDNCNGSSPNKNNL